MKIVALIPARYKSTRFPGKILANDTGKFLLQHTYEQTCRAQLPGRVIIAADDERVLNACRSFGAECIMTSPDHNSGTDRIAEAVADLQVDLVVNVQADEPEIAPAHIDYVAELLIDNPQPVCSTLVTEFENEDRIADPNVVKAVLGRDARAIYFSRLPIPYHRDTAGIGPQQLYLRHLGLYAYRKDFLLRITSLPQTPLEKAEKLEQLRTLEYGYSIITGKVTHTCEGIDTPQQYARFVKRFSRENSKKRT